MVIGAVFWVLDTVRTYCTSYLVLGVNQRYCKSNRYYGYVCALTKFK